jgi:hypothetical protein
MTTKNGNNFAKRLMDQKYGTESYDTDLASEYDKIKEWGDRAFE